MNNQKEITFCTRCGSSTNEMCDSCNECINGPEGGWIKRVSRKRKQRSLQNMVRKNGLTERAHFPNVGTVIIDGKYTYYAQKKLVKVKDVKKTYQMRGFQHFVDCFLKKGENNE